MDHGRAKEKGAPESRVLRRALFAWAFNPATREQVPSRERSVFYNALGYAVEQGHLAANPIDRIQWTTPAVAQGVDRRVVVSPAQARAAGRRPGTQRPGRPSMPAWTTPPCAPRRP